MRIKVVLIALGVGGLEHRQRFVGDGVMALVGAARLFLIPVEGEAL